MDGQPPPLSAPPSDLLNDAGVFLDFDGTLVEIASRPDAIIVDDRLRALIDRLAEILKGRLAIISGRPVHEIRAYLPQAGLAVSGSHGLELHHADGRIEQPDIPPWLPSAVARAHRLAAAHEGMIVEEKPFGLALHYRLAPDAGPAATALAEEIAAQAGASLQPGKMVVEVRLGGSDKGTALRRLMEESAMAAARPVFVGDDVTDESAFAAAADLGGAGILVGPPRETAACYRLPDVAATIDWLEAAPARTR